MIVFKATDKDMSCHMGGGHFQYEIGKAMTAERCKCGNTGLHACEYVIDCMRYYPIGSSRYFMASAEGDIAEDGCDTRIACTSLTLIAELETRQIVHEALAFMVHHPHRDGWECESGGCTVRQDKVESFTSGIVIARGENPMVKAPENAWVGLLQEKDGKVKDAGIFRIGGSLEPHRWYSLEDIRKARHT